MRLRTMLPVVVCLALVPGCNKAQREKPAEMAESVGSAKDFAIEKKNAYLKKLEAQLKELEAKTGDLKQKASTASEGVKAQLAQQLADLDKKREALGQKLQDVKTSSSAAWGDLKDGMDAAMEDLKASFEKAKSRFN
jgi:hypothetical protein